MILGVLNLAVMVIQYVKVMSDSEYQSRPQVIRAQDQRAGHQEQDCTCSV